MVSRLSKYVLEKGRVGRSALHVKGAEADTLILNSGKRKGQAKLIAPKPL